MDQGRTQLLRVILHFPFSPMLNSPFLIFHFYRILVRLEKKQAPFQ